MPPTSRPWSDRHPNAFALLAVGIVIAVVALLVWLWRTPITMPLLVPTGLALWVTALLHQLCRRWRRERLAARQEQELAAARAEMAQRPPMTVDLALDGLYSERIGNAERTAVLDFLSEAYSSGHLAELAELEQRSNAALTATYRRDLAELIADLPR